MIFKDKLIPVPFELVSHFANNDALGANIAIHTFQMGFPEMISATYDFVIIGATADVTEKVGNEFQLMNEVRRSLYSLFKGQYDIRIADWGNVAAESDKSQNLETISQIISVIHEFGAIPIILGGNQDITYANYLSYKFQKKYVTLALVDSRVDFDGGEEPINEKNYLNHVIYDNQNRLFDLSVISYQNYLVSPTIAETMRSLGFELIRLADVRANIDDVEPAVRGADFISIDMSAVRYSDSPNSLGVSPNGLRGEEICKIARFAGMSEKLNSFGVYNHQLGADNDITVQLTAQVIWHFIDGFYSKISDSTDFESQDYIRYDVNAIDNGFTLRFYKNKISGRWWIGIPVEGKKVDLYNMTEYRVPCSQNDYFQATQNEIPEKWLNSYKKLHD